MSFLRFITIVLVSRAIELKSIATFSILVISIGGWLWLSHGILISVVKGFVSPSDGKPQVEIEILEKVKRHENS